MSTTITTTNYMTTIGTNTKVSLTTPEGFTEITSGSGTSGDPFISYSQVIKLEIIAQDTPTTAIADSNRFIYTEYPFEGANSITDATLQERNIEVTNCKLGSGITATITDTDDITSDFYAGTVDENVANYGDGVSGSGAGSYPFNSTSIGSANTDPPIGKMYVPYGVNTVTDTQASYGVINKATYGPYGLLKYIIYGSNTSRPQLLIKNNWNSSWNDRKSGLSPNYESSAYDVNGGYTEYQIDRRATDKGGIGDSGTTDWYRSVHIIEDPNNSGYALVYIGQDPTFESSTAYGNIDPIGSDVLCNGENEYSPGYLQNSLYNSIVFNTSTDTDYNNAARFEIEYSDTYHNFFALKCTGYTSSGGSYNSDTGGHYLTFNGAGEFRGDKTSLTDFDEDNTTDSFYMLPDRLSWDYAPTCQLIQNDDGESTYVTVCKSTNDTDTCIVEIAANSIQNSDNNYNTTFSLYWKWTPSSVDVSISAYDSDGIEIDEDSYITTSPITIYVELSFTQDGLSGSDINRNNTFDYTNPGTNGLTCTYGDDNTEITLTSDGDPDSTTDGILTYSYTLTPSNSDTYTIEMAADSFTDYYYNYNSSDVSISLKWDGIPPSDFTVGTVSSVEGTVVDSYYNTTNTDITVVVPIDDDSTLPDGTVQILSSTTSGSGFESLGDATTITSSDLDTDLTITITEATFTSFSQYGNGETMYFNAIITDRAGNTTTGTQSSSTLTIDTTDPTDFTVGTVSSVGGQDSDVWNDNSTSITVVVPIDNDSTLIDGTVQIIYSTTSGGDFVSLGDPTTITDSDIDTDLTISISYSVFELSDNYANGNTLYFNANITDVAGNVTTGTESTSTITIDTTDPNDFTVGKVYSSGGNKVDSYFNSTNTYIHIVVPIDDETDLIGGTVQILSKNADGTFTSLDTATTITSSDLDTDLTITITSSTFKAHSQYGNGETMYFNANITDNAGNSTTGTQSSYTLVIHTTVPTDFTVGDVSSTGGTVVDNYFNTTNTDITVVVPIDDDSYLNGGNVQILSKKTNGSFASLGSTTTITSSDLDTNIIITISKSTFRSFSQYGNDETMFFNAIITDITGNPTTGTMSNSSLIVLETPYFYNITSTTNNNNNNFAKLYDIITLSMTSSQDLLIEPSVSILINGVVIGSMNVYNNSNNWYATYTIKKMYNGTVKFLIRNYYDYAYNKGNSILTSSSITVITNDPISPYVKYFDCYTGSTKTSLNNRIDILFSSDTYKWEHSVNGGISFSNFTYGSSPGTLYLDKGVYLSGDIIIRNYDIVGNYSELTNAKTVTITSSSTGYPVINASTNKSNNMKKAEYIRIYSK